MIALGFRIQPQGGARRASPGPPARVSPTWGVVWTPPADARRAARDLRAIRRMGAEAVRVDARPPDALDDPALLTLADSLGLALWIDLTPAYLSAEALADTLPALRADLRRVVARARRYRAIRHVGLLRHADTTDPAVCDMLAGLVERVRRDGPTVVQTYYVTPFAPEADRCTGLTDRVLFDVREHLDPLALEGVGEMDGGAWGLAALGTWVTPEAVTPEATRSSGRTPEAQARYLEDALSTLHPGADLSRSARGTVPLRDGPVFVYRWRDGAGLDARHYGLHTTNGTPRRAAEVAAGFFSGRQTTFALATSATSSVPPHASMASWLVLVAWALVLAVGVAYARRPRFRYAVGRYFQARVFYRDSVRGGRDLLPGISALLVGGGAAGFGVVAAVVVRLTATTPGAGRVMEALPAGVRAPVVALWTHPLGAGAAFAGLAVAGVAAWSLALALAPARKHRLRADQLLMLLAGPQWPLLGPLVAALVAAQLPPLAPATALGVAALLAALAGAVALAAVARTLTDYSAVARVPPLTATGLALLSPPVLGLLLVVTLAAVYDLDLGFLVRLLRAG